MQPWHWQPGACCMSLSSKRTRSAEPTRCHAPLALALRGSTQFVSIRSAGQKRQGARRRASNAASVQRGERPTRRVRALCRSQLAGCCDGERESSHVEAAAMDARSARRTLGRGRAERHSLEPGLPKVLRNWRPPAGGLWRGAQRAPVRPLRGADPSRSPVVGAGAQPEQEHTGHVPSPRPASFVYKCSSSRVLLSLNLVLRSYAPH